MDVVGFVALGVVAVGVLTGVGLVVASLPDLARYRRLRRM
jgi:hypothetical protein